MSQKSKIENWQRYNQKIVYPIIDQTGAKIKSACAAGCAWCCHQHTEVNLAEATTILSVIPIDQRNTLKQRLINDRSEFIRQHRNTLHPGTFYKCPFLDNENRCSIYAVRPMICRSHYSDDAQACKRAYTDPEKKAIYNRIVVQHELVGATIQDATNDGLFFYEMGSAILLSLIHISEPTRPY